MREHEFTYRIERDDMRDLWRVIVEHDGATNVTPYYPGSVSPLETVLRAAAQLVWWRDGVPLLQHLADQQGIVK